MNFITNILEYYNYRSISDLLGSLMPSVKYSLTMTVVSIASIGGLIETYLGMSYPSLIAFVIVMPVELISGIQASKEKFNTRRFSRFLFKLFYYLVMIFVARTMSIGFLESGETLSGNLLGWVHQVIIVQIVIENIISISENVAKIEGKDPSHYVTLIKSKLNAVFGVNSNINNDNDNQNHTDYESDKEQ